MRYAPFERARFIVTGHFARLETKEALLYNGGVTSGLINRENERRFLTLLVCAGRPLTG